MLDIDIIYTYIYQPVSPAACKLFVYSLIIFLFATATVPAPVIWTSNVTSYALGPVHRGQH